MGELDMSKAKRYAEELNRTLSGEDISSFLVAPRKIPWRFFGKTLWWKLKRRDTIYWCIFLIISISFTKMIFGTIDAFSREQIKYRFYVDPQGEILQGTGFIQ